MNPPVWPLADLIELHRSFVEMRQQAAVDGRRNLSFQLVLRRASTDRLHRASVRHCRRQHHSESFELIFITTFRSACGMGFYPGWRGGWKCEHDSARGLSFRSPPPALLGMIGGWTRNDPHRILRSSQALYRWRWDSLPVRPKLRQLVLTQGDS